MEKWLDLSVTGMAVFLGCLGPFLIMMFLGAVLVMCLKRKFLWGGQGPQSSDQASDEGVQMGFQCWKLGAEGKHEASVLVEHVVILQPSGALELGKALAEEHIVHWAAEHTLDQVCICR